MATAKTQLELQLLGALRRIANDYQTAEQLLRTGEKQYGCSGSEALEYAYENIQALAKTAIRGVRVSKPKPAPHSLTEADNG